MCPESVMVLEWGIPASFSVFFFPNSIFPPVNNTSPTPKKIDVKQMPKKITEHCEHILKQILSLYSTLLRNFNIVNMQHSSCKHVFSIGVKNSVDHDQLASNEES